MRPGLQITASGAVGCPRIPVPRLPGPPHTERSPASAPVRTREADRATMPRSGGRGCAEGRAGTSLSSLFGAVLAAFAERSAPRIVKVVAHDARGRNLAPVIVAMAVAAYGDRRHLDGCAVVVAFHVMMACGARGGAVGGMAESGARKPAFGEAY